MGEAAHFFLHLANTPSAKELHWFQGDDLPVARPGASSLFTHCSSSFFTGSSTSHSAAQGQMPKHPGQSPERQMLPSKRPVLTAVLATYGPPR